MLYKSKEGLILCDKKVKYIQHGEEKEQFIYEEGIQWWLDFCEKWNHTEIIEFIDVEYTTEELRRFDEIKDFSVNEEILSEYVINGTIGEGLEDLENTKEIEKVKQLLADLALTVLMGGAKND